MTHCNNVIFSYVSYRRNIKDMPFVNKLNDQEQAIGISRALSEIFVDEFEFKSLKNIPLQECLKMEENGILTKELIENKDISAFAFNDDYTKKIYINEQEHIRLIATKKGFDLETAFVDANCMDDQILEKLEMCYNNNIGYLTANPSLFGTGMQIGCVLFLPALCQSKKINKLKTELLKSEFEFYNINGEVWDENSPFIKIQNIYTFGYKENEFAEKLKSIVEKLIELERLEENNIFNLSASTLADNIFRAFGLLYGCYRISYKEAEKCLSMILWGINLKMLKLKKKFDVYSFLATIKENNIALKEQSVKEIEKQRAKLIFNKICECVEKGEVDV